MAKKRRQTEQIDELTNKPKESVRYQDAFQSNIGKKIEEAGQQLEGKWKNILYGILAIVGIGVLVGIFISWNRKSNFAEQSALGKAIETSKAQISASPMPAGFTGKSFKTEKERAEAAVNEFQAVVDKYGSEKAKYFVAVNKLTLDRQAAVSELETLSKSSGEVGVLAKFALAQAKFGDNKLDEAATIYAELAQQNNPVIAKDTINFNLAGIYEKQGKKAEALELYFNIAKQASEAKDSEGKPLEMSQTARQAKEKVESIDPKKAEEIKEPEIAEPM